MIKRLPIKQSNHKNTFELKIVGEFLSISILCTNEFEKGATYQYNNDEKATCERTKSVTFLKCFRGIKLMFGE